MRLILLNRYFHPDHSATSQMLSDLAFGLAAHGHRVAVIASRQRYDSPAAALPGRETVGGVAVHRVWTTGFGRAGLLGRVVDYATFYVSAAWRLWRLAKPGDVVVAKTDPPMLSAIAAPVCRRRGARLVNWLQDIFPETAEALGIGGGLARPPFRLLRRLRDRSLKAAHMNVVLGRRMAERVAALGVAADRIRIAPNWADGAVIAPVELAANALRREWQLGDAFVVGYSGNLGRAHEIGTLLEAMTELERAAARAPAAGAGTASATAAPMRPVLWLLVGGGVLLDALKGEVARLGLTSVRFQPYQPKERLAESLSAVDLHLVSLRPELEGLVVPSKVYGIAAAGRPALFVGDETGEVACLIARHKFGLSVRAGDGAGLARAVLDLAADPALCRRMGESARAAFEEGFDRPVAVARWEALLEEAAGAAPG